MPRSKLPMTLPERPIYTMRQRRMLARVRGLKKFAPACLLAAAASLGAQHLPPTPPTSVGSPSSMAAPIPAATPSGNTEQHHRAHVSYADGMLEVRADNSSLNQILRDISRQTGMKIVGGVADQRIFGVYGPASAPTVLQTLLDGTGANVLLKETPEHAPEELVLSPRTGGIAPPGPSSPTYDATETEPELPVPGAVQPAPARNVGPVPQGAATSPTIPSAPTSVPPPANNVLGSPSNVSPTVSTAPVTNSVPLNPTVPSTPPSMPQPANNVLGSPSNVSPTVSTVPVTNSVPLDSLPTPSTAPPVHGIVDAPNPPPAGSTTAGFTSQTPPDNNPNTAPPATSPATTPPTATQTTTPANGVKTPQQIYQELLQMQQQQKSNQKANPQGSSAPQ